MSGILAYGSYLPYHLLERKAITDSIGVAAGKGTRTVASFDEDTTSMGVEAARAALRHTAGGAGVRALFFATTRPAYADKTNANAIHAALALDEDTATADMVGAVRSGIGALRAALSMTDPTLAVLSDIRTGIPGSPDERLGGDGAAALLCAASGEFFADYLGGASTTAEFLDRWRQPGEHGSRVWEERFVEHAYLPLAEGALTAALKQVDLSIDDVDHLIVTGTHPRAVKRFSGMTGARADAAVDDRTSVIGNTGTAHPGILLADVLDRAVPGDVIALAVLADGCDVLFFRATDLLPTRRQAASVDHQISTARPGLPYPKFQLWRGVFRLEPPRRPDLSAPSAPPSFRYQSWKFAFTGSVCSRCETRHLPPQVVCMTCQRAETMRTERFSDLEATLATFTVDHLTNSESPPVAVGVLNFDGGGRYQCEITDTDPATLAVGDRLEMTFRKIFTASGVHNYFWKARSIRGARS
jgi:3-hydroxy-3-methylglutaryl CoA synthase/uncharacterized OB-fold protein